MHPKQFGLEDAYYDSAQHRAYLLNTHIPNYLGILEGDLGENGDAWLGGMDALSMADIAWHQTLAWLQEGNFAGVDQAMFDDFPAVCKYLKEVGVQLSWNSNKGEESENDGNDDDEENEELVTECKKEQ